MKYSSPWALVLFTSLVAGCPSTPADPDAGLDAGGTADTPPSGDAPTADAPPDAPSMPPDAPIGPDTPLAPDGTACTDGAECAAGNCVDGVCCESACDGTCEACVAALTGGTDGECSTVLAADPEDECDASGCQSGACGSGACELLPASTVCRAAAAACDVAEVCDGVSPLCPTDAVASEGTTCRPVAGDCDVAELCDGGSADCPADTYSTGTVCRSVAGACDVSESCSGTSPVCPADAFSPAGTPSTCGSYLCGGASGTCPTSCASSAACTSGNLCLAGTCTTGWRMFVTSNVYAATSVLSGDTLCRNAAAAAGLSGDYRAWYSTSTVSASARLYHPPGPIYRVDGSTPRIIAADWADLVDGIAVAIATDEFGNPWRDGEVWTGTNDDGTLAASNCNNWTTTAGGTFGLTGNSSAAAFSTYFGAQPCSELHHLYCLQQPPPS